MSDRSQVLLSAAIVAAFVAAYATFYFETKPDCPKWSDPRWTRSGWLCTVRPLFSSIRIP